MLETVLGSWSGCYTILTYSYVFICSPRFLMYIISLVPFFVKHFQQNKKIGIFRLMIKSSKKGLDMLIMTLTQWFLTPQTRLSSKRPLLEKLMCPITTTIIYDTLFLIRIAYYGKLEIIDQNLLLSNHNQSQLSKKQNHKTYATLHSELLDKSKLLLHHTKMVNIKF